ncbi:hypothetical protein V2J09_014599 [Rumex salicifolius]
MGCTSSKMIRKDIPHYLETSNLASQTSFSMNEVEALYVLYKQLSSSDDGIIHKEELQLALLGNSVNKNIFLDRVFSLFDVNQKGVIEFGDFVRSISIFHPKASQSAKIEFAFSLYDLRHTGYIEREELKEMVLAIVEELGLVISDDLVEAMLDKTFMEVDTNGDGKIDPEEWKEFVMRNPSLMKIMTLQCLKGVSTTFPSFIMNSQVKDTDLTEGQNDDFKLYNHLVAPVLAHKISGKLY